MQTIGLITLSKIQGYAPILCICKINPWTVIWEEYLLHDKSLSWMPEYQYGSMPLDALIHVCKKASFMGSREDIAHFISVLTKIQYRTLHVYPHIANTGLYK